MEENLKLYYFNHNFPPVHYIKIAIPKGNFYEPLQKKGITEILSANLFLYSQKYKNQELKGIFDKTGADYEISVSEEAISITLKVMEENFEKGLILLLDSFLFPEFSRIKFKSSRKMALGSLKIALTDPQLVSEYHLFDMVFGKNHPLGKNQTPETIKNIKFKDLNEEFENLRNTKNWGIFISSPWQKEKIFEKIQKILKNYEIKNLNSYSLPETDFSDKKRVRIVPKKNLTQVPINILIPSVPRKAEEYLPLKISYYNFAEGGFSSRILKKIRVEMGSTYGVLGSFDSFKQIGYFQISGMVKNADFQKSVEILKEIYEKWKKEGISQEELEEAKSFYIKNFRTLKDDPLDWGNFILKNHIYNFPENYDEILLERIKNINLEDILKAHLKLPENIPFWCFLGDEKIIEPVALNLGKFEIKKYFDF